MSTVEKIADLQSRRVEIEQGGGKSKIDAQHGLNKLTARERIEYLLDGGSFMEIGAFIEQKSGKCAPAEAVVCGWGTVDGRPVYVWAQDFTVLNGAVGEMHAKKIANVTDMALKNGVPVISLIDCGGVRIDEGVEALGGLGEIMQKSVTASGVVPQICAVMGAAAGGMSFIPALSDFVFMVENTGRMYITAPSILSGVQSKNISLEDMGNAQLHSEKTGAVHFTVTDDKECLDKIRVLLSYLPSNNLEEAPLVDTNDSINRAEESLITAADNDSCDVRDIINKVADLASFIETQAEYAKNIVTGFARMNSSTVGIVANQPCEKEGALDIAASEKAARFVRFCDSFNIPVITFTDVPGYVPDVAQEQNGIVSKGAKLISAYAEATVPKINIILKRAYGSAYIAMCSKQLGADCVIAWPTAEISVMSPSGAAILVLDGETSENPTQERQEKINEYKTKYANPYQAAKYGFIDDIAEPDSTRPRIIAALEMFASKREIRPDKKHTNLPI